MFSRTAATRLIHPVNPARCTAFPLGLLYSTTVKGPAPPRRSSSGGPSSSNSNARTQTNRSRPSPQLERTPRHKSHSNSNSNSNPALRSHFRQNGQPYDDSYLLCDQVRLLCSRDQLERAIDLVRRTPARTCTVVVWNVLINEVLQRFGDTGKAYELWMEMKRRGFVPSTRSFATALRGFASVANKVKGKTGTIKTKSAVASSTTLSRARTIHSQWVTHLHNALGSEKMTLQHDSDELSVLPTNHFLTFLGNTEQWDLLLETFNSLPAKGPLAPNSATYSLVLGFLKALPPSAENFQLAIGIYNRMIDTLPPSQLDNRTLSIVLSICRDQVRPDDQALGISIATQIFGLLPLNETHRLDDPTTPKPLLRMDSTSFSSVLTLLLKMQRYNLAVEWFDQVRDHGQRFGTDVIGRQQCELVLQAWVAKRGDAGAEALLEWMHAQGIEPSMQCYALAIKACWKNVNLSRAYHILSRMTGQNLPTPPSKPISTPSKNSSSTTLDTTRVVVPFSTKRLGPSSQALTYFLHTALSTRDRAQLSEALSTFLSSRKEGGLEGKKYLFDADTDVDVEMGSRSMKKAISTTSTLEERYFRFTLHRVLERCLNKILDVPEQVVGRYLGATKVVEWEGVWERVKEWVGRNRHADRGEEEGVEREESMERRYELLKKRGGGGGRREGKQPWEGRGKQTIRKDEGRARGQAKHRIGFEKF
ncbi:BZ3500_MvSof-1268-A1-R1_Chr5-1g07585 [Microbotryum saponariae]|uniref:BZ3500_MvSof-1268-A1-R1_Chr5-1g07585 protein n=1 Tax=Microbotryum saponariae TaxID=289078 RepID=A0A2X0MIZ9_9BASI|nr:BZ3500_MvSof-1268-A1-R1_Chr5-1g07585 [Microbotryum saponariae]SDA05456.1 BZ3501_MvSof-1269-A2-R1_Chr5-2g07409 [Microbotryum saponariae]